MANFQNQLFIYNHEYTLLWAVKLDATVLKIGVFQQKAFKGGMIMLTEDGTLDICYVGSELPEAKIEPLNENIDLKQIDK